MTATTTQLAVTVRALDKAEDTVRALRHRRDQLICALAEQFTVGEVAALAHINVARVKEICARQTSQLAPASPPRHPGAGRPGPTAGAG
jgi:hypothetical protein